MFWTPDRAKSLVTRFAAWYTVSAFLLLTIASGLLYWALVKSFDREDNEYLAEKVNTLRTLLKNRDFPTLKWEVEGEARVRPSVDILSRVLSPGGHVIIESSGMGTLLPPSIFPSSGEIAHHTTGKRIFRLLSERETNQYIVQVGVEVTYEENLLAAYRRRLWVVLCLGLLGSVLVGSWIARRGIRPVEEIAGTVRRIRSTTLNERIVLEGLPSELSALASTFNEMLDRLEDAFGRLSRFSSDIAHELRTPVNNLRGEVEVALAKTRSLEEYRDVLGSALEECQRLSRLISSLLFLARAENPCTQILREQLDIRRELATVRDFYEAAATDAGVALELKAPEGVLADLDRTLFQRAVSNLVENSLAYTPPGGRICLEAARENGTLLVAVSDTGRGIPAEHLPHVFDRFHRVDPARSAHLGGAGLGLAIVKSIASLHGGAAEIESEAGRGTCVTLRLPCAQTHSMNKS